MPAHVQLPYTTADVEAVPPAIRVHGLCTTSDLDFFAEDVAGQTAAVAVCAECPVQRLCLTYALANEEFGVWGGATESQRAALRAEKLVTPEQRRAAAAVREALINGGTVAEIARRFEVTERTIYRYKARMRQEGRLPLDNLADRRVVTKKQDARKVA